MTVVSNLTHDQIADIGAAWVKRKGFPVSFSNMRSAAYGEQPDVLGFNAYGFTFLLESKVTRSDFFADQNKPWRTGGKESIGDHRGYITPANLLKPSEIPYGWWLLEVHGKNKPVVKIIKGEKKVKQAGYTWPVTQYLHCDRAELNHFNGSDKLKANNWLIKVIQRSIDDGVDMNKYAQAI